MAGEQVLSDAVGRIRLDPTTGKRLLKGANPCTCCCNCPVDCPDECLTYTFEGSGFTDCLTCLNTTWQAVRPATGTGNCACNWTIDANAIDPAGDPCSMPADEPVACQVDCGNGIPGAQELSCFSDIPESDCKPYRFILRFSSQNHSTGCSCGANDQFGIYFCRTSGNTDSPEGTYQAIMLVEDDFGGNGDCGVGNCSDIWTDAQAGTITVTCNDSTQASSCDSEECDNCRDLSNECTGNEPSCTGDHQLCTPDTVESDTTSVAVCTGECINSSTNTYKLTGTTSVNTVQDLLLDSDPTICRWSADVAGADYVLTRATTTSLSTLTYRATRISTSEWRFQVFASGGGETVYFFDGIIDTGTGLFRCSVAATANNSLACDLAASPRTAGNSGTFDKPGTFGLGNNCSFCGVDRSPEGFDAVIADVNVCTDQCDGNRYRLTGSTAINRTIELSQSASDPCILEATVASNYVLHDADTAAAAWNITTIRYLLEKTGFGSGRFSIIGVDSGGTERVGFVGESTSCAKTGDSFGMTSGQCNTWPTVTHPTRDCCAVSDASIAVGSGGSTDLTACPALP